MIKFKVQESTTFTIVVAGNTCNFVKGVYYAANDKVAGLLEAYLNGINTEFTATTVNAVEKLPEEEIKKESTVVKGVATTAGNSATVAVK